MAPEEWSSRPLRVAMVCPYSLSRPGGVQGQSLGLARRLRARGHEVTVYAPVDGDRLPYGAESVEVTGGSVGVPANGSRAPIAISPAAVVRAVRSIRSSAFDVVHVHEPFAPGVPYGLLLASGLPPMVTTFHRSGSSLFYAALGPLIRSLAGRFAARCAVSEAARQTAARALGGTYLVGFNGVEMDRFENAVPWPSDDRPVVLFLGRHEERKGLSVLLEAFGTLQRREVERGGGSDNRPVLWIAGDGPETGRLRRLTPESDDIHWLGVLSEREKERRLASAAVVCAPSLGGESFGMVLLEAMAARAVVVASDIEGYRRAAGGHALTVPPGNAVALSMVLESALPAGWTTAAGAGTSAGAPCSRADWLDAAVVWARHWSMEHLAGWYEDVYRSVVRPAP
ncbi:MAG: glycosyltransferase family 4 protein [Acidimicrobiales bacterium]